MAPWYGYSGWDDYAARNAIGCTPGTLVNGENGLMYRCRWNFDRDSTKEAALESASRSIHDKLGSRGRRRRSPAAASLHPCA